GPADQQRDEAGQRRAGDDAQPRWNAEVDGPDGDRISADAEKAGMAEAHLAGKAHQQIEPHRRQGKNEHEGRDAIVIGRRKQQRQDGNNRRERDERPQPVRREGAHPHTRSTRPRPNRPCGMASNTARMTRKATASLYFEDRKPALNASSMPRRSPPTTA